MSYFRILAFLCVGLVLSLGDTQAGEAENAKSKNIRYKTKVKCSDNTTVDREVANHDNTAIVFARTPSNSIQFAPDSLFERYFNLLAYLTTKTQEDSLYAESDEFAQLKSQQILIENNINEEYNLDNLSDQEAFDLFEEQYQEYINDGEPNSNTSLTCLALYLTCLASGGSGKLCMLIYEICTEIGPPIPTIIIINHSVVDQNGIKIVQIGDNPHGGH
ncbi:MAG: hypothetical protein SF052_15975 [Bacteroidia bacterium]|nr:hypothetical protein [Bacteroidia bacterium]